MNLNVNDGVCKAKTSQFYPFFGKLAVSQVDPLIATTSAPLRYVTAVTLHYY